MEPIEWILLALLGAGGFYVYNQSKNNAASTSTSGSDTGTLDTILQGINSYTTPSGNLLSQLGLGAQPSSSGNQGLTMPNGNNGGTAPSSSTDNSNDDEDTGDNSDD
jgi:hypothetical protein